MIKIEPNRLGVRDFYKYMVSAISPRPIALVSTIDNKGQTNVSPFSFFNYMGIEPPIVVFAPNSKTSSTGEKDTLLNILEVPEIVVNLVDQTMIDQISLASAPYERGISEFAMAGFTPLDSEQVQPPRVGESLVQLECNVLEVKKIGTMSLVIAQIILAHIHESILADSGFIDEKKVNWLARAGGDHYHPFLHESLISLPRSNIGIGVSALPISAQQSEILTGSDLAKLGMFPNLPTDEEILTVHNFPIVREILSSDSEIMLQNLHLYAKKLIVEGNLDLALKVIFISV